MNEKRDRVSVCVCVRERERERERGKREMYLDKVKVTGRESVCDR